MRWRSGRRSQHIEDRRGRRTLRGVKGGGLGAIIIALIAIYFGVDPALFMQGQLTNITPSDYPQQASRSTADDELRDFVSVVLADTEDTWHELFRNQLNRTYEEPTLVLFSGAVQSACGFNQAAVGPFYCPADHKVYIDLDFYQDLKDHFRAPGDFAQAYVIAHEVGHHVQTLLGISQRIRTVRKKVGQTEGNELSVRQELQADCFAGVWAHNANRARHVLEAGDIEEGLNAASAIGDDRIQRRARGYVAPESFTHGSSAQRVRWFKRGLASGDLQQCDTFQARQL